MLTFAVLVVCVAIVVFIAIKADRMLDRKKAKEPKKKDERSRNTRGVR
jgi:large-conductance mechanosensitive channel